MNYRKAIGAQFSLHDSPGLKFINFGGCKCLESATLGNLIWPAGSMSAKGGMKDINPFFPFALHFAPVLISREVRHRGSKYGGFRCGQ